MIPRLAGYATVVAVAVYLYFMYDETVISGILVFLLLYFPVSFFYLLGVRKKITADLGRVPPMGEKRKQIRAGITLKNQMLLMSVRCEACVSVRNFYDSKGDKKRFAKTVPAGEEETVWCVFETEECGNTKVCLEYVRLYDFLGIFCVKRKENKAASVRVMPGFEPIPVEITRRTREFQSEAEENSQDRKGDDPSELYQVREYRVEDPLKDIHWKLSAKEETLMVKERGFPLGCAVLLWFDVREGKVTGKGFSAMIEKAASLSVTLAEEKCVHMAAWYEEENERILTCRVRDEESACSMIWKLMEMKPCRDVEKREACREDTFRGREFSSIVTIDGEGNIWKDGEMQEFLRL